MCGLKDFWWMELDDLHRMYLEVELEMWHNRYLPVGKTVLDVGAGCGETAFFYLNHGAQYVICVESDPGCIMMLRKNFGADDRVTIVRAHVNSVKVDIEGGEMGMVIETHFPARFKRVVKSGDVVLWRIERSSFSFGHWFHLFRINMAHVIHVYYDSFWQILDKVFSA